MTNTEIIQAIRNEIERLYAEHSSKYGTDEAGLVLYRLEDFLDSLEPEKPMNQDELEVELSIWRHCHFHGARDGHFNGEYLERTSQLDLARHFAEWGYLRAAEKDTIDRVCDWLEKNAVNYNGSESAFDHKEE